MLNHPEPIFLLFPVCELRAPQSVLFLSSVGQILRKRAVSLHGETRPHRA